LAIKHLDEKIKAIEKRLNQINMRELTLSAIQSIMLRDLDKLADELSLYPTEDTFGKSKGH